MQSSPHCYGSPGLKGSPKHVFSEWEKVSSMKMDGRKSKSFIESKGQNTEDEEGKTIKFPN